MEFKKTWHNGTFFILGIIVLFCFSLGWFLPVGLDKKTELAYGEYIFSTYTVLTQFGFLLFSFIVAHFFTKEYVQKTILFYRLISINSVQYFFRKVFVLIWETILFMGIFLFGVSIFFHQFAGFFQIWYLFSAVAIQYVFIIGIFSFLLANILLAIGTTIAYWILSIILATTGGIGKYLAIFDASNSIYKEIETLLRAENTSLPVSINVQITLFLFLLFVP